MDEVGLRYQPTGMEIRRDDLRDSLLNLRRYVSHRSDLWYTVINERDLSPAWVESTLATLKL